MKKSDSMRVLMKKLFYKKKQHQKPSDEKKELEDHIFESNQSFQMVRKKIVRKK
jgi:hypothetical protein